ncbi:carboxymuconolactone decarboxylase family protein [Bradyrhizobium sp. CNPSo 4010]|uniref:Alkyl hydroperoxide reductase AhpD n=1 Tax=Bradyrhizobium agreste TaxID=2751811 RepID=A0ABS0PGM0_9BRAD|nr:carboxymuconolactone decarboxylase family protein [Bradyrhizobium agreste]MBH5396278.1 carboxymuconolactone decarboxylase family protein [Bradyrhizobium agreste]
MSIGEISDQIPDFAKDVRLNFSSMVADETLREPTRYGLFLACAVATRNRQMMLGFETLAATKLTPEAIEAAKAVASVMAMSNIYYRFVHLASNKQYRTMPARLRMSLIGNPGVDKADCELWSLAVSAINGCAACIDAHEKALQAANVAASTIQTAVRFAAIIQSVAVAIESGRV